MVRKQVPRVLLIGAGRFGKNHLRVLLELEREKKVSFAGVVVKSRATKERIEREFGVRAFTKLPLKELRRIDAVDIATPTSSHYALVKRYLPHAHIFVEKPLAENVEACQELGTLAEKYGRKLMAGHIYRFHPLTLKLKVAVRALKGPLSIEGRLTKPMKDDTGEDPALEFLHLADIIDYIFGERALMSSKRVQGRAVELSVRYPNSVDARLTLGWVEGARETYLSVSNGEKTICADFQENTLAISKGNVVQKERVMLTQEPLRKELQTFLSLMRGTHQGAYPDFEVASRVIAASNAAVPTHRKKKIAIIGAGLFGTTAALELSRLHHVTVFERNADIMTEASFINQYRHHWGYHYPRSNETVRDIRRATADFEAMFEPGIIRNFPTYYCVAKHGSKVSPKKYIEFCKKHDLPFQLKSPGRKYVQEKKISLSLRTLQPIYNFTKLRAIIRKKLTAARDRITLKFNSPVIGGYIAEDGSKILMYQDNGVMRHEAFDYVVNVTYANHNLFASWFGFLRKTIRVDLVETLIMRIPIPKISFAIMDGPFTNVVPTEKKNIFTLVHIKESILERFVPSDGLIPPGITYRSNAKKIIDKSAEWLPFLKKAKYIESRYVFRSVNAYREHDDAQPSDVTYHGFGAWSVLGGKIVNCVTTAKEIFEDIARDTR